MAVAKYNKVEAEAAKKENREPLILPKWFPYQLRHSAASEVANILSKEDAKLLLSHRNIGTTDIYIHEQIEKLKAIARKMEEKS